MAREINSGNSFSDKLVKFIPTEIIGVFMTINAMLRTNPDPFYKKLIFSVFIILALLTPIYLWRVSGVRNKSQIAVATLSFVIWVYTLGGTIIIKEAYDSVISSVILMLWTLIPPLFIKADKEA